MQTTIIQADIDKALTDRHKTSKSIGMCCVVYQAAVRCGHKEVCVGLLNARMDGKVVDLDENAQRITKLYADEWHKTLGVTIELPDLEITTNESKT